MKLPDKVYDALKWIALIVLPAIGALYFGLAKIWGFPYGTEITGTIALISTFIGTIIGISTVQYNKENKPIIEEGEE